MNPEKWLPGIIGTVRCAQCGTSFTRQDISIVGSRDDHYSLRCVCHNCGTQGVGVVFAKEVGTPTTQAHTVFRCDGCGKLSRAGPKGTPVDASCPCYHPPAWIRGEWRRLPTPATNSDPALSIDDVLTAHEELKDYKGEVHGLFGRHSL